ncbi:hypothetical protein M378DRAFT_1025946, partial [Amanita muscaria Koide BX008]
LRSDPFERAYALKWLTGFVGRSDTWLHSVNSDDEEFQRAELVKQAAKLINAFSEDASSSSTIQLARTEQTDRFPSLKTRYGKSEITVQLNDAPLSSSDHTSVGLQSWGSSIIFAERLCSDPASFFSPTKTTVTETKPLRVLELGAGTGLLSITTSKIAQLHSTTMMIARAATDFHPDVLTNLTSNIATNTCSGPISVYKFDCEHPEPNYLSPPFNEHFDVILILYTPLGSRVV